MSDSKEITRLVGVAQKGESADVRLRQMRPTFEAIQDRYYRELVVNTAEAREVDQATVWKMVALNDVILDLRAESRRGRAASAKLQKQQLAKTGGSDA